MRFGRFIHRHAVPWLWGGLLVCAAVPFLPGAIARWLACMAVSAALMTAAVHPQQPGGFRWPKGLPGVSDLAAVHRVSLDAALLLTPCRVQAVAAPFHTHDCFALPDLLLAVAAVRRSAPCDVPIRDAASQLKLSAERLDKQSPRLRDATLNGLSGALYRDGRHQRAFFSGKASTVLSACTMIHDGHDRPMTDADRTQAAHEVHALQSRGLDVTAYAMCTADDGICEIGVFLGVIGIGRSPVNDAAEAMQTLTEAGISVSAALSPDATHRTELLDVLGISGADGCDLRLCGSMAPVSSVVAAEPLHPTEPLTAAPVPLPCDSTVSSTLTATPFHPTEPLTAARVPIPCDSTTSSTLTATPLHPSEPLTATAKRVVHLLARARRACLRVLVYPLAILPGLLLMALFGCDAAMIVVSGLAVYPVLTSISPVRELAVHGVAVFAAAALGGWFGSQSGSGAYAAWAAYSVCAAMMAIVPLRSKHLRRWSDALPIVSITLVVTAALVIGFTSAPPSGMIFATAAGLVCSVIALLLRR